MDAVQRKLALLDKQSSGIPLHEHIFGTSPLLFVALGLITGIVFQHYFNLPAFYWFLLLIFFAITSIVLFVLKSNSDRNRYFSAYLAFLCFLCLGSIRLTNFMQPKPNDIRKIVSGEPVLATIRGFISVKPRITRNRDWKFAQFMPSDPGSSFYMKLDEIETISGWRKTTGKLNVRVDEPVFDLEQGDYIQAYCWLEAIKPPSNPGQFNFADFQAKKGIYISASIKSRIGIKVLKSSSRGAFTFLKVRLRELAETALLGDLPDDSGGNGLIQALLLGYREDIDNDTNEAFRKTGLSHYISLSGMHMGIIIGLVWWISKLTGLMKRGRAVICIIAIVIFLFVIPPMAPALRAAIIALMFCLSFIFRRQTNAINTLSLAAIILLLFRPSQLFEAGWQLSFSSVLGLILFSKNIERFLRDKISNLIKEKYSNETSRKFNPINVIANGALTLFCVGLAAWLTSAGILLYHFHTITPLASLWTVLTFPLISAILILGFIKILLFFFLPSFSFILGVVIAQFSDWLIAIVKLLAKIDISEILIGHVPLGIAALLYSVFAFSVLIYYRRPELRKIVIPAAVIIIIMIPGILKWQRTHNDDLIMTCLDVGHGQAIFFQFPSGENILFDAGSMYRSNIGANIIMPFMDYSGISGIDAIIISHNDIDHLNGIPEIVEYCDVDAVYANNDFFSKSDQWGTAQFLSECLRQMNIEIEHIDRKTVLGNDANMNILWPVNESDFEKELSDNNKSLVSLIEFSGVKILLCSDIEQFAQKEILRLYPDLKADIVVVPHHGSTNTLDPDFLKKLDASIFICSSDKEQPEENQMSQKQWFITSRDGAINVVINKNGNVTAGTYKQKSYKVQQ